MTRPIVTTCIRCGTQIVWDDDTMDDDWTLCRPCMLELAHGTDRQDAE